MDIQKDNLLRNIFNASSEQFGTNLRSTVTTTVPNFIRGSVVPITLTFSTKLL